MTAFDWLARQAWIDRLGWTLVHSLWQGVALALILTAALRLGRRADARVRYGLACVGLFFFTLCPPITFALLSRASEPLSAEIPNAGPVSGMLAAGRHDFPGNSQALLAGVVALWICGSLLFSARLVGGWSRLEKLRRSGWEAEERLYGRTRVLIALLDLHVPISVRLTGRVGSPSTFGWLRPVILLPAGALVGLSAAQIDALLAHELAHIRRADYLVNLWQMTVETIFYYHPAVWWMSGVIRKEREFCCDDIAVRITGDAAAYATALATLEETRPMSLLPGMAASGGPLVERVKRILGRTADRPAPNRGAAAMPAIAAAGLAITFAVGLWSALPAFGGKPQDEPARKLSSTSTAGLAQDDALRQAEFNAARARQEVAAAEAAAAQAAKQLEVARARQEVELLRAERATRTRRVRNTDPARKHAGELTAEVVIEPIQSKAEKAEAEVRRVEQKAAGRFDPDNSSEEPLVQDPSDRRPANQSVEPATQEGADRTLRVSRNRLAGVRELLTRVRQAGREAAAQDNRAIAELRAAQAAHESRAVRNQDERAVAQLRAAARAQRNAAEDSRAIAELKGAEAEVALRRATLRARIADRSSTLRAAEKDAGRAALDSALAQEELLRSRMKSADTNPAAVRAKVDSLLRGAAAADGAPAQRARNQSVEAKIRRLEERTWALERQLIEMDRRLQTEQRRSPDAPAQKGLPNVRREQRLERQEGAVNALENQRASAEARRDELTLKYTPDHPLMQRLDNQIRALDDEIKKATPEHRR